MDINSKLIKDGFCNVLVCLLLVIINVETICDIFFFFQPPNAHQPSFVDANAAFQDLSESFRSLYKSVFENSQGMSDFFLIRENRIPLYYVARAAK